MEPTEDGAKGEERRDVKNRGNQRRLRATIAFIDV
jgi:hypothetical protein